MTASTRTHDRSGRSGLLGTGLAAALATAVLAAPALPIAPAAADSAPAGRFVITAVTESVADVAAAVRAVGGTVVDRLPLIGGVSAELPPGAVLAPSYAVVPDRALQLTGAAATGPVSTVRATLGLGGAAGEGAGVTVAVVDTGVADHPDLAGRVTHVDVTGEGVGDGYGHGTFIAGLVAGSGASSGGAYAGVAPGASVLDVKVGRADGSTDLVTVLRGLQAAARSDVDVLNLSLSSDSPLPYQLDPLNRALQALWEHGVTVVVPSGNDGTEVSTPGNDPLLLTVGGLDEGGTAARADDVLATWSGRGPTDQGVAKPDLVAPGTSVVSLRAAGSVVDGANSSARVGTAYFKGSGTSFATAVTSGAAAVLLAERRLSPDQVKALVTDTAYDAAGLGPAGGLDLAAALSTKPLSKGRAEQRNDADGSLGAVPGDPRSWAKLLSALASGDLEDAASSWGGLSPAARNWAARNWAGLPEATREWAARNWAMSPSDGWGPEWAARNWAARNWAASSWAARNWAAGSWAASSWAGRNWSARNWADAWDARNWSARNWSARNWSEEDWSARNWSARNWSEEDWSARNWMSDEWTARNWSARNWTARNWTARNWTAVDWV